MKVSRKTKFWKYVRDILEYICLYGLGYLLYNAFGYGWKAWVGFSLFLIIYAIHGYELYRANNQEYFNKLEEERLKAQNEKH